VWISVIGGPGTQKHAVVKALVEDDGFVPMEPQDTEPLHKDPMSRQIWLMVARWRMQREIMRRAAEEDIVTVRTFWDTHHAYSGVMLRHGEITDVQFCQLRQMSAALGETLEPPKVLLHLKATRIDQHTRQGLKERTQLSDELLLDVEHAYENFIDQIRVPVLLIDVSRPFEQILADVRSEVTALRATQAVGGQSIWQRSFFRSTAT